MVLEYASIPHPSGQIYRPSEVVRALEYAIESQRLWPFQPLKHYNATWNSK